MSCRVALVLDTLRAPCCFARDAFYDTLYAGTLFGSGDSSERFRNEYSNQTSIT